MSDETKELGGLLKAKRAELKLSLKEIENSTSIRIRYLEAIEDGKLGRFVSGIYAQGFMKQYALFLGFDAADLAKAFPAAFHAPNERNEFSYGIGTLEVRGNVGGGIKWLPIFLWSGFGLVILIFAWYLAKMLGIV